MMVYVEFEVCLRNSGRCTIACWNLRSGRIIPETKNVGNEQKVMVKTV